MPLAIMDGGKFHVGIGEHGIDGIKTASHLRSAG